MDKIYYIVIAIIYFIIIKIIFFKKSNEKRYSIYSEQSLLRYGKEIPQKSRYYIDDYLLALSMDVNWEEVAFCRTTGKIFKYACTNGIMDIDEQYFLKKYSTDIILIQNGNKIYDLQLLENVINHLYPDNFINNFYCISRSDILFEKVCYPIYFSLALNCLIGWKKIGDSFFEIDINITPEQAWYLYKKNLLGNHNV